MESWRRAFREGMVPLLSTDTLRALRNALEVQDPRLVQRETAVPSDDRHAPVEGACLIGFCGWHEQSLATVGDVEEFFADFVVQIERRFGGLCADYLISFFDATERSVAFAELLAETERALAERNAGPEQEEAPLLVREGASGSRGG